ncbi:protein hinderin isoform X2 [Kryptolebias marmoratus]|uniref:Zgc:162344 n=1 Tax=Kryptolebias marmoratus TaxID=37003 RepID=A0A3Q3GSZ5_KRYMA|nr:protein hinderin isoform X2 [Kryptolebias marmoratus]
MATAAKRTDNSEIFWMNGVSDEEQPLAFVPGVERGMKTAMPFSLRADGTGTSSKRGTKLRVKHGSDCKIQGTQKTAGKKQGHLGSDFSGANTKEKVPVHHAAVPNIHTVSQPHDTFHPLSQVNSENSREKSEVSLKDLCFEDKRRIANLIEELARVSEEKEESVQRLKDEQGNFERKVQQLEQQNLMIAQERESLQRQYRECQELLGLYQQYLTQQQAKLNQSIAQLSQQPPSHSKVLSSEEAPSRTSASRANGSLLDGSYLSLAATGAQKAQTYRSGNARRGAVEMFGNPVSVSRDRELSPNGEPFRQHVCQKRECRQPHTCCIHERCQGSCHDTGCRTQQWRSDSSSCLVNCHHDTSSQKECERNIKGSEAKEDLTRPLLGHKDWEEKRHQLLLQKMQLESERKRLQARLAEQEERLSRQTEQLRQSQLDYSRIQQPSQAQLSSSTIRNAGPEQEGPSHQGLPSSLSEEAEAHSAAQGLKKINTQGVPALSASGSANPVEQSRRDTATSPAKSPSGLSLPSSVSAVLKTPETKLDLSVVDLLDIFSPISGPELFKPGARRPKASQHKSTLVAPKSAGGALLTPSESYPQSFQQDLEESQILDDIFFIC